MPVDMPVDFSGRLNDIVGTPPFGEYSGMNSCKRAISVDPQARTWWKDGYGFLFTFPVANREIRVD